MIIIINKVLTFNGHIKIFSYVAGLETIHNTQAQSPDHSKRLHGQYICLRCAGTEPATASATVSLPWPLCSTYNHKLMAIILYRSKNDI